MLNMDTQLKSYQHATPYNNNLAKLLKSLTWVDMFDTNILHLLTKPLMYDEWFCQITAMDLSSGKNETSRFTPEGVDLGGSEKYTR